MAQRTTPTKVGSIFGYLITVLVMAVIFLSLQGWFKHRDSICLSYLRMAKKPSDTLAVVIADHYCTKFTQKYEFHDSDRTPFIPDVK